MQVFMNDTTWEIMVATNKSIRAFDVNSSYMTQQGIMVTSNTITVNGLLDSSVSFCIRPLCVVIMPNYKNKTSY